MAPQKQTNVKMAYAHALQRVERQDYFNAQDIFAQLTQLLPNAPEPLWQLGRVNLSLGRPATALTHLEKALRLRPNEPAILADTAMACARLGAQDRCLSLHDKRIRRMKGQLGPLMDKALALQQFGAFSDADRLFQKARSLGRKDAEFYRIWFAGRRVKSSEDGALVDALKLWGRKDLTEAARMHLGFALAKAMQDLGDHNRVFEYLVPANAAQAKIAPFERAARESMLTHMRRVGEGAGEVQRRGTSDFAPIIVTGMPRSGTTLVERILSAHPDVRAGGEIGQAQLMSLLTFGPPDKMPPLSQAAQDDLDLFAERYATSARETAAGDAPRVTDKSIQTHLILGHIAAAFPKAHLIVVRRDPRDIALSIYRNHFALGSHRYACRLEDIAYQMHSFDQAVAFWKDRVNVSEIDYDALVADPEPQSRALVAMAGLSWDAACLRPEDAQGSVTTLSLAQVRQPIYKSSSGGWQRHEAEMAPFLEAWDGYQ